MKQRSFMISLLFILCLCSSHTQAAKTTLIDRIIAVVNNDIILWSEWKKQYDILKLKLKKSTLDPGAYEKKLRQLRKDVLDRMVDDRLLLQQAQESKVRVTEGQITAAIADKMRRHNLTQAQFREAQRQQGFTEQSYRNMVRKELQKLFILQKIIREKVTISPADERAFYKTILRSVKPGPPEYLLYHILFPIKAGSTTAERTAVRKKAEKVLQLANKIKTKEKFISLARFHSEGADKKSGGALGWLKKGDIHPVMEAAMIKMKKGSAHPSLLRSPLGIHILFLANKRLSGVLSFEEARPNIQRELRRRSSDRVIKEYLQQLRKKAVIQVRLK